MLQILIALCVAQAGRQDPGDSTHALKQVPVFRREATFVAKDRHLHFLDVTRPGEPLPVFRLNWLSDLNVGVALAENETAVIATDGTTIYRVAPKGDSKTLASLNDVRFEAVANDAAVVPDGVRGSIHWFFATSDSRKFLYFVLESGEVFRLARLDLASKKLKAIDLPVLMGEDVDMEKGVIYAPEAPPDRRIAVKDFDGTIDRHIGTTIDVFFCKLSPGRKRLLLSNGDLVPPSPMVVIDLTTGKETLLPVEGCHAVWGDDSTIFFLRGSNSLWRYQIGAVDGTEIKSLSGKPAAGFALTPCVSTDRTWLAWCWTSERGKNREHGTILIDLKNREYRSLTGWWHNVQWLVPQ
jgi:hypothetical protein